jgi:hypothetical protein
MSFRDQRGLAPEAAAAADTAGAARGNAFADDRPLGGPSFRDQRQLAADAGAAEGDHGASRARQGFGDTRSLDTPSFRDERTVDTPFRDERAAPSFRDERTAGAAPSFRDERTAGASPSFRDERTAGASPSFRDQRTAGASPSFRDERIAGAAPSFRDERIGGSAATFRDERDTAPSFRDDRVADGTDAAPSFRDDRIAATAPSFRDDRMAAAAAPFRDERTGSLSFRDDRGVAAAGAGAAGAGEGANGAGEMRGTRVAAAGCAAASAAAAAAPKVPERCDPPEVSGEALDGGRMSVRAHAACHAGQTVRIAYGGAELIRTLDASGNLDFTLDCFAGAGSPVDVRFPDGTRKSIPAAAYELDKVSKVAVIWRAPVNLDLHVFEYAARFGQAGHVWAKAASNLGAARSASRKEKRGHGFISSIDSEDSAGDKIEVYTFLHHDEQASGTIGMALDYETRGDNPSGATCGDGAMAEVDFQVVVLSRGGNVTRQGGVLTRVDCGTRLGADTRYSQSALPSLRIRK